MSFGTTSQIIPAARVKIQRSGTELELTSDVKARFTRIRDRLETRAGPIDTFRWALAELECTVALTELLKTQLQTDFGINTSTMAKTYNNWTVAGTSISGVGGDNTSDVYSATLVDYEELAPDVGVAQARIKLVVAPAAA